MFRYTVVIRWRYWLIPLADKRVGGRENCVIPRAIPEHLRGESIIKRDTHVQVLFTLLIAVTAIFIAISIATHIAILLCLLVRTACRTAILFGPYFCNTQ